MQRRKFIQHTGMVAFGVGVFGTISWDNEKYIGDTATTTDMLGPFYRPNAPLRVNINPAGYTGPLFHLSGTVCKADGKTVKLWVYGLQKKRLPKPNHYYKTLLFPSKKLPGCSVSARLPTLAIILKKIRATPPLITGVNTPKAVVSVRQQTLSMASCKTIL